MATDATTQAIEVLIHDYGKLVFHVIYGLTGNFQDSEDLTQETFLQAFRGIEAARAASGVQFQARTWLLRIAVNTVRMSRRRRHGMRFLPFADLHSEQYAAERCEETAPALYEEVQEAGELETMIAERDSVQRCMDQMPETLRVPLLLSVVAGFSSRELAEMLVLNEATVRQRLSRARKAFQCLYARECGEHIQSAEVSSRSRSEVSRSRGHLRHLSAALPSVAF